MVVPIYSGLKCEWILSFDDSLSSILMVLEIFNNKSVNSTIKYKFEYKLGGFHTWRLVPYITD